MMRLDSPPTAWSMRRSRSIAANVFVGLLLTGLLFASISSIALLGFVGFQESLNHLSQRTFPEATSKAQISILLNELLHYTATLHDATSHPARRTAYLDIEEQFARIEAFAKNLEENHHATQGPKIDTLKNIVRELNELVQERIIVRSRLQEAVGQLLPLGAWLHLQGREVLAATPLEQQPTVAAWLRQCSRLLELAHHAASAQSLQILGDDQKTLALHLTELASDADRLAEGPAARLHAIVQQLREQLLEPLGLLPLAHTYQRLVNESRTKTVFAESLVREKEEAHIAGFFDLTSEVGRQNQLLTDKVRTHIALLSAIFLTSIILGISFFFYFRRVLIARLQKLNRQVLALVAGERVPVAVEEADEITEIARSVNYFAEEMSNAREAAEQAAVAKAEFLAHMSHEIRTPMNAILGFSELALHSDQAEDHRDCLTKINTAAHTLLGIVNTVLDYSKIEAGKFTIDHAPFDLRHLLENLAILISPRSQESGLEFYCQISAHTPYALRGDGLRLGQVLTNLITNAFKFTERGSVTLHIDGQRQEGGRVMMHFAVHDTGSGIPESEQDKLFQPFSQADTSMTRRHGGTGLGLAICKRLVEMMGGEIGYARGEEGGSVFSFFLPLLEEGTSDATFFQAPPELQGKRVLVMSEVARTASELSCLLQAFGCVAVQALSPEEVQAGLQAAQGSEKFAVLIVDCAPFAPHRQEILTLTETGESGPAVILTGLRGLASPPQHQLPAHCFFVEKPILPERLLNALLRALDLTPAPLPSPPSANDHGLPEMRQRLLGHKVLLVEDNDINRQVALGFLRAVGLSITTAANGAEALEILRHTDHAPFELVLMDLQMPVMDGYSATQAIRRLPPPICSVPILALTAHALPEERDKCLRLGMVDLLAKPIDPQALYAKLVSLVGNTEFFPQQPQKLHKPPIEPSPPGPTQMVPVIDLVAGRNRVMGDDQLHRLLLRTFIDTYGGWWQRLEEELAAGHFNELGNQAHTLKGASGNLGMGRLQEQCARLEQAARWNKGEECRVLIEAIAAETTALCQFLEHYLLAPETVLSPNN